MLIIIYQASSWALPPICASWVTMSSISSWPESLTLHHAYINIDYKSLFPLPKSIDTTRVLTVQGLISLPCSFDSSHVQFPESQGSIINRFWNIYCSIFVWSYICPSNIWSTFDAENVSNCVQAGHHHPIYLPWLQQWHLRCET